MAKKWNAVPSQVTIKTGPNIFGTSTEGSTPSQGMEVTCVTADDDNYFFVGTVKTNYNSEVFAEDTIGTNAGMDRVDL